MNQGSILSEGLSNSFGSVVAQSIGGQIQSLKHTKFRCQKVMKGLCPLKSNFVSCKIKNPQSIVFKRQLLDCINSIAVKLVFSETQFFETSIDLKHFGIVNGAFLSDALIIRTVKIEGSERAVIPVENTGYANDSIDIQLIVPQVKLFKGHTLLFVTWKQKILRDALNRWIFTMAPAVPILLYWKLRYFND